MRIYLFAANVQPPFVDFSTLVVIQLFHSVSSCSYRKNCLVVDTNLQQYEGLTPCEWAHNHGGSLQRDIRSNRWKTVLVSLSLKTYDDIFFECLVVSASSRLFQTLFTRLTSCQLMIYLASQTLSVSVAVPIAYRMWVLKWLELQNTKGLACETKPTVCKHKQK